MTTKTFIKTGLMLLYGLALTSTVIAQENLQYPSPRYPELREVQSTADLLDIARTVVNRPSRGGQVTTRQRITTSLPTGSAL